MDKTDRKNRNRSTLGVRSLSAALGLDDGLDEPALHVSEWARNWELTQARALAIMIRTY